MVNSPKTANYILFAGYAICLLQVWLPGWYLTGDGPCHLYNAQILHDVWTGKNTEFYSRFFEVTGKPNPNWMSHVLLAALLFVVHGVVAEKILLSCYVVFFVSGFARLLKRLDNKSYFWPVVAFVFVFHYVLAKGFYNFSFSIAFMLWLIDTWLQVMENRRTGTIVWFFVLACLTFFAHPVAFVFGGVVCAGLTVSFALSGGLKKFNRGDAESRRDNFIKGKESRNQGRKGESGERGMKPVVGYLIILALCMLPCGLLLLWFAMGEAHDGDIVLHVARYKLLEFADFNCLVNVTSKEVLIVRVVWIMLVGLLLYALIARFRKGFHLHRYDGLLVSMMFAGFLYLFFPDKIFGGSLFVVRAQYLWALFTVCCIGYMLPAGKVKNASGLLFFLCFIGLSIPRTMCMGAATDGVKDIVSAEKYIRPYSVVLPLDFAPGGFDKQGNVISDRNWLFCHAWQYMGLDKPLIILDNYEANTGYFPLVWKDATNPYHHLCTNGAMEGQPPFATINDYKRSTGVTIDYVLMWCYDNKWRKDEQFNKLYDEIDAGYHIVYRSPTGRTILYARGASPRPSPGGEGEVE